jgi:hypothetical protein
MNEEQNWVEALKINPENLSQWSAQAPTGIPLLVWCLENGYVSTEQYMNWASQAYQLPVLRSEYFQKSFDIQLLNENRDNWEPWCFPVDVWDDTTIVACVEPPPTKPEGKVAFVLADPVALMNAWNRTQGEASPMDSEEAAPPPLDAPVGVDLNATKTFQLNLDHLTLGEPSTAVDPHPVKIPPPPPAEKEEMTLSVAHTQVKPPAKPTTKPTAKPTAAPIGKDEKSQIAAAFAQLRESYQAAMILKCRKEEAVPYKWDDSVQWVKGSDAPVSLTAPSLFRIVAKTSLPYHGYIVDSPAHREFFARMGLNELPACVTAVPLLVDNTMWGLLLAYGDDNAQTQTTLESTQKIADNLANNLRDPWLKNAA